MLSVHLIRMMPLLLSSCSLLPLLIHLLAQLIELTAQAGRLSSRSPRLQLLLIGRLLRYDAVGALILEFLSQVLCCNTSTSAQH